MYTVLQNDIEKSKCNRNDKLGQDLYPRANEKYSS